MLIIGSDDLDSTVGVGRGRGRGAYMRLRTVRGRDSRGRTGSERAREWWYFLLWGW